MHQPQLQNGVMNFAGDISPRTPPPTVVQMRRTPAATLSPLRTATGGTGRGGARGPTEDGRGVTPELSASPAPLTLAERAAAAPRFSVGGELDCSLGPAVERRCTDIVFLLLFLLLWATHLTFTPAYIRSLGPPAQWLDRQDAWDNTCGRGNFEGFPRLSFAPNITHWRRQTVAHRGGELSVYDWLTGHDPNEWQMLPELTADLSPTFIPVCAAACPRPQLVTSPVANSTLPLERALVPSAECAYDDEDRCLEAPLETLDIFGRFCLPLETADGEIVHGALEMLLPRLYSTPPLQWLPGHWRRTVVSAGEAVLTAWPVHLGVACFAVALSLFFAFGLTALAAPALWAGIICLPLAFAVGSGAAVYAAVAVTPGGGLTALLWMAAVGALVVALALLALLLGLSSRIREGIALLRAQTTFFSDCPQVTLSAASALLSAAAVSAWTFYATAALALADRTKERDLLLALTVVLCMWSLASIAGLSHITEAGMVAYWYFSVPDEYGCKAPKRSLLRALRNALFHTGSAILGGFILTTTRVLRWILGALLKRLRRRSKGGRTAAAGGGAVSCLTNGIPCAKFLPLPGGWCNCAGGWVHAGLLLLERLLAFLASHAYVQIALLGKGFLRSSWAAFCLLLRHPTRMIVGAALTRVLRWLGVVLVAVLCAGTSWAMAQLRSAEHCGALTALGGVIGFCTADWMLRVIDHGVDAMMQCFLADVELHSDAAEMSQSTAGTSKTLFSTSRPSPFTPAPLAKFVSLAGQKTSRRWMQLLQPPHPGRKRG